MTDIERDADGHPVYYAPAEDLGPAVSAARATFRYFWREMTWEQRRIIPGNELAAVKLMFWDEPGGHVEHMWVNELAFDGRLIHGVLLNQPHQLRSVQQGQPVSLPLERLTDWMLAFGGRVYGAFTVQELRTTLSPADRRAHDDAWGFDFGDPTAPAVMPYDGGPDDEHPMSLNMREKLGEHLAANPDFVRTPMAFGFTPLHFDSLGGNVTQVAAYLDHGADPTARTEHGMTPLDLAELLGWEKVIARLRAVAT